MDGERISLRLEPEDLRLMDEFIADRPEFSSRSHLARIAIRAFIEGIESQAEDGRKNENAVTVELPRVALKSIEHLVRMGIYTSVERAIEDCVREKYVPTKDYLEEVKKKIFEASRETLEIMPLGGTTDK